MEALEETCQNLASFSFVSQETLKLSMQTFCSFSFLPQPYTCINFMSSHAIFCYNQEMWREKLFKKFAGGRKRKKSQIFE